MTQKQESMNPFEHKSALPDIEKQILDWKQLYPRVYDKMKVDPYTKTRIILMNGIEVDAALFGHNFHRNCDDNDLRRDLALVRRVEQQQQKEINWMSPGDETQLETTIGYEHLAVDLTAWLAAHEPDPYVKQCMDFALLEDFDHLYRYSNLLKMDPGYSGPQTRPRFCGNHSGQTDHCTPPSSFRFGQTPERFQQSRHPYQTRFPHSDGR